MKDNEDNMAVDANHETDITDNYYASSKKMVESNFTKLLKDRCYELDKTNDNNNDNDKNNDDNDSHKNNKKISSFKLLKLIANYESKISLYGQIEGFHNQLEMTFSELQKANKDYDLHHKQLEEIKNMKDEATIIANNIIQFETKWSQPKWSAKSMKDYEDSSTVFSPTSVLPPTSSRTFRPIRRPTVTLNAPLIPIPTSPEHISTANTPVTPITLKTPTTIITTEATTASNKKMIDCMKTAIEHLVESVDANEITQIKQKIKETEARVQKLTKVLTLIHQANSLVANIKTDENENENNELNNPSSNRVTPMCTICMTNPFDSCLTCGHTGCFDCLARCELKCPFCNAFSDGITRLFT